ncbi:MAG TPA: type II toxin-antitoxin system VapC family toxin [Phenylobacterium sp.]|uniref:type II toxin-antitoxin system VapC family toxin n=1 Tax=Phenylobacterium sp. TaxID=1871053 RepID=UPI002CC081B3|nr:type II toxin-antitoxin system VapC family toxin [Phenylobacterium sp.]HSV04060.1 type II toxin-antitoxin system VapC family toxin [Phenylobacterium sp.]
MSAVLVDSNVLIDIMTDDPQWAGWAAGVLQEAADAHRLVINPIIYAEVSVRFSRIEEMEDALPRAMIEREPIPYEAAFLAGKAFMAYRRRGGSKTSPLPDFFIGAHAAVAGHLLITRDPSRYRSYFPTLEIIAPDLRP